MIYTLNLKNSSPFYCVVVLVEITWYIKFVSII